jgi:hypothetical protein
LVPTDYASFGVSLAFPSLFHDGFEHQFLLLLAFHVYGFRAI